MMNKKSWPLGSQILHPAFRITLPTAAALVLIPDLPPIAHGSAGRRTRDQCVRLSGPYTSSHREKRRPSSRLGRKTKFRGAADDNYNTKTHMLGLQWERIGQRHRPPSDRHGSTYQLPVLLVASRSRRTKLKRPKIAVAISYASKVKDFSCPRRPGSNLPVEMRN